MSTSTEVAVYDFWNRYRGKVFSKKGGWIAGEDVFCHGYSIMKDLVGNISYMQMIILNASGRLVSKSLAEWFEAHFICLSWPDPRIWCNQVGAISGNMKCSVTAASVAGVLAADSRIYGGALTSIAGVKFIKKALTLYRQGWTVEKIIKSHIGNDGNPKIMGFVRPVNGRDERIAPMIRITESLGFEIGEHMSLANQLSQYLLDNFSEGINIGGFAYAFAADQGISGDELYKIRCIIVASGVTACAVDTLDRPGESFLPLRCDDIDYGGVEDRRI